VNLLVFTDKNKLLLYSVLVIVLCELTASFFNGVISPIAAISITRSVQTVLLVIVLRLNTGWIELAGLSKQNLGKGIKTGIAWSAVFGCCVIITGLILYWTGINPLRLIQINIRFKGVDLFLFFLAGGLIAPVSEEIFFRGILYSILKKFGLVAALVSSTLIFAFFHSNTGVFPVVQIIGGLIFALSFEYSKSLAAPIIIHSLGNLAIFSISFIKV